MDLDERKIRLYKFLLKEKKIKIEEIPEDYKEAVTKIIL